MDTNIIEFCAGTELKADPDTNQFRMPMRVQTEFTRNDLY